MSMHLVLSLIKTERVSGENTVILEDVMVCAYNDSHLAHPSTRNMHRTGLRD